jgi:hypothetical protein
MYGLAPYLVGGLAAVLVVDHLAIPSVGSAVSDWLGNPAAPVSVLDRSHKADRLTPARAAAAGQRPAITAVEMVGLRDTAVVYRDREGRVLFRTDPLSNATLVAKDVVLPEITIRDSGRSTVNPVPIEVPAPARAPERAKLPPGCDPAFSPLTLPSLSRLPSRCIAENEHPARVAALGR